MPEPENTADRFPLVIAEWPRNDRELVRISLGWFKSSFTIDLRTWWRDSNGILKPRRDGLTLAVKHLPKLAAGFDKALQRAKTLGLLELFATSPGPADRRHRKRLRTFDEHRGASPNRAAEGGGRKR
jgi:hypothetical protein